LIGLVSDDSVKRLEVEIRRGILASMTEKTVGGLQSVLDLNTSHRYHKDGYCRLTKGEKTMQGLKGVIIVATIVAATVALGGCFGHHEKAVATQPLKLGSATVVEQVVRV
jgi:hypothetical protein